MSIGQRMKQRRKALHMTADELGRRLGKDRSTIYRYENGEIENMPLDILEPIAAALQTTPQFLMGWNTAVHQVPIEVGDLHGDMVRDAEFNELYDVYRHLDARERQIIKDLAHSLVKMKTET